jgi:hypothetical protein
MRAASGSRVSVPLAPATGLSRSGWLQAGFCSFAYRLAHLALPRPASVGALALIFLLV